MLEGHDGGDRLSPRVTSLFGYVVFATLQRKRVGSPGTPAFALENVLGNCCGSNLYIYLRPVTTHISRIRRAECGHRSLTIAQSFDRSPASTLSVFKRLVKSQRSIQLQ